MFLKLEQADEVLAFWELKGSYKFKGGIKAPDSFVKEALVIRQSVQILNRKGRQAGV